MTITIYLESNNNKITKSSLEIITAAQLIAKENNSDIFAIIIDDDISNIITEVGLYGVPIIKCSKNITSYQSSLYAKIISNAVKDSDIIIFPSSVHGNELAPMIAMSQNATSIPDVIDIIDQNTFKRSVYGNKIHQLVKSSGKIVLTIRSGIFDLPNKNEIKPEIIEIQSEIISENNFPNLAEVLNSISNRPELNEADIIVSGGRGTGSPENFATLIEPLADKLGAAIGASRAVVDAGWRPHDEQVGQTGKFVSPKLYIAVGISGAIQHLAGMSSAEIIVAINTDKDAPIFKIADYGLVGDLNEIIPKLLNSL